MLKCFLRESYPDVYEEIEVSIKNCVTHVADGIWNKYRLAIPELSELRKACAENAVCQICYIMNRVSPTGVVIPCETHKARVDKAHEERVALIEGHRGQEMSENLEKMMREFQDETRRLIQLQFGYDLAEKNATSKSVWCFLVSSGNIMVIVPGTSSETAEEAVEKAMKRWKNRKNEPFIYTTKE